MSRPHSRRIFLEVLGAAGGALVVLPLAACSGGSSEPNCNDTTGVDTAARQALHYVPNGPDAARHCTACQLYVGGQNGCGTCNAFPGPVSPQGTCDSFVPRA